MNPMTSTCVDWANTPKTKPENVHILYFDAELDGTGGWIRCNAKIQLSKRMYGWGEKMGTLLAEIVDESVEEISGLWVLKRFLGEQAPDIEMGVVRRQAIASQWAARFEETSEFAYAPFLKMVLVQLIQRKGKPLARMEELVEGHYERFVMKAKKHLISHEELEMLNSFEEFVYKQSPEKVVVTSVQRVGDRWTEPIFHSKDKSVGGQSDRGEQGIMDWLQEFSAPSDPLNNSDDDPSSPAFVNPSIALPILNAAGGQTFIGDLTDDTADSSPDQSLEVDGLQMSSQKFASHLSSQRRAPSPHPGSSPRFLSGRSLADLSLAPIVSRETSHQTDTRQTDTGEHYLLHTSSQSRAAYISAMNGLSQSPRPLGDDARAALDLHLSNRDMWESRKTASIDNSWSGINGPPLHCSQNGSFKPPIFSSVHSSMDGRRTTPVHVSASSSGAFTPHNIHTSSGGTGQTTRHQPRVASGSAAASVDDPRSREPPLPAPSSVVAESTEAWAQALRELSAGGACDLQTALTVRDASVSVGDALQDCAARGLDVVLLAPAGARPRAVACAEVASALLRGRVRAADCVLSAELDALPAAQADTPLPACLDAMQASQHGALAVLSSGAADDASILGVIGTRHLVRAMQPGTAAAPKPTPRLGTPRSPIISTLLISADSNPHDPEPPSFPPPQPPIAPERAGAAPPSPPPPAFPPPRPPPASPVRTERAPARCSLGQWQRSGWTQALTLLLFLLDLALVLLVAPADSPWSSALCGRWHSTAAVLLGLPLLPEALARCVVHRLRLPSPSAPHGSFPLLAATLSTWRARALYALAEGYDLVVLAAALLVLCARPPHALHPRSSAGGALLAALRALRLLRAIPAALELRAGRGGAELLKPLGAGDGDASREDRPKQQQTPVRAAGQQALGKVEEGRDAEVVDGVEKTEVWLREQAASPDVDAAASEGKVVVGVDQEVGRYATGNSGGAVSEGAGIMSTSIPYEAETHAPAAAAGTGAIFSPAKTDASAKVSTPAILLSAASHTPENSLHLLQEAEEDQDLPAPTNNYARTPAKSALTGSGRPLALKGSPSLSPSLTSSLRAASPSQPPPHVIVTGSLVNDHHPSTDLTAGSEGKGWMVHRRNGIPEQRTSSGGAAGGDSSGVVRPPLYPVPPKGRAARSLAPTMKEETRRSSSGRDGHRIGFVSLFPDPK